MDISKALLGIRKETGYSQNVFADKLGITQSYLSQIEHGKKTPSIDLIECYCDIFKKPIAFVLWMALEEKDVPESKKAIFRQLKPLMDNFISQVY
jgi:transcriptional regulator with XRE-family HTH domain